MLDIFELRRKAAAEDLKNRRMEKNYTLDDELPVRHIGTDGNYDHCKCGNILTIADSGKCDQCRRWPHDRSDLPRAS